MFDIDDGELICIKNPTSLNARYTGEDSMNRLRILDNKKNKKSICQVRKFVLYYVLRAEMAEWQTR